MFDGWMRLLQAGGGQRALAARGQSCGGRATCAGRRRRGRERRAAGVRARACRWRSIWRAIALADLFLDTLPYNAHTTASDALWAGLPVLTRIGETFAGRWLRACSRPSPAGARHHDAGAVRGPRGRARDRSGAARSDQAQARRATDCWRRCSTPGCSPGTSKMPMCRCTSDIRQICRRITFTYRPDSPPATIFAP